MVPTCIGNRRRAGRDGIGRVRTAILMKERERADVDLSVAVCSVTVVVF